MIVSMIKNNNKKNDSFQFIFTIFVFKNIKLYFKYYLIKSLIIIITKLNLNIFTIKKINICSYLLFITYYLLFIIYYLLFIIIIYYLIIYYLLFIIYYLFIYSINYIL